MTVNDLIEKLRTFDPTATLILRDLNGLDWFLEPGNIKQNDYSFVLIDSQNINVIEE